VSDEKQKDEYEVGYGKPPKETQFKKGVSGNPTGRRKKPTTFEQQLIREVNFPVVIDEGGRKVRHTKMAITIKQWTNKAMMGDASFRKSLIAEYQRAFEKEALSMTQKEVAENRKGSEIIQGRNCRRSFVMVWRRRKGISKKRHERKALLHRIQMRETRNASWL
jgi:hypothetical protein